MYKSERAERRRERIVRRHFRGVVCMAFTIASSYTVTTPSCFRYACLAIFVPLREQKHSTRYRVTFFNQFILGIYTFVFYICLIRTRLTIAFMIVLSRISMVSLRTDVTLIRCKFIRDSFTRIFNRRMSGIFYLFFFVVSVSDRGDDRKSFMFEVSKRN